MPCERLRATVEPGGVLTFAVWTSAEDGNPVFEIFERLVARELGEDLVPFGPFSFGRANEIERAAIEAGLEIEAIERREKIAPLCDPRTLVLFDLLFLGRPGDDGNLQPLFDPGDASKDHVIEALISELEIAVQEYRQADGSLLAPSAAHMLVAKVKHE